MDYPSDLRAGHFLRRVNRFLAEVDVAGKCTRVHVPNSGRNQELFTCGRDVRLVPRREAHRKTRFDLSLVRYNRRWVSVDARLPNSLVEEAWRQGRLRGFGRYAAVRREVPLGDSRLDLLFERGKERCYVEVKSVTLVRRGTALFPDAPTARGARHVSALAEEAEHGRPAALIFVVQRNDARELQPFAEADPLFAQACCSAKEAGVKLLAFACDVSTQRIALAHRVPVRLPGQDD